MPYHIKIQVFFKGSHTTLIPVVTSLMVEFV
jgi:hypothetical protein